MFPPLSGRLKANETETGLYNTYREEKKWVLRQETLKGKRSLGTPKHRGKDNYIYFTVIICGAD
jgi:hypothetical protein